MSFFFNDPSTTEIYTLSLHDALPISAAVREHDRRALRDSVAARAHLPVRELVHRRRHRGVRPVHDVPRAAGGVLASIYFRAADLGLHRSDAARALTTHHVPRTSHLY